MKPIRRARHALMFFGAGAVAAYFLDPESGAARRDRVMQQVRTLSGEEPSEEPASPASPDTSGAADAPDRASTEGPPSGTGRVDVTTGGPVSPG